MEQYVVSLDFGESYIKLVKASITGETIHICSTYKTITKGFKNGEIYSKSELQDCINYLISQASDKKNPINKIVVVLPSDKLIVARKKLEVNNEGYPEHLTTKEDIINLKKQLSTTGLKDNEMSVGLYPISYYSDGRDIDKLEPTGERCKTYGLEAFVASLPIDSARGFIDAIEEMGISVLCAIIAPIASSSLIIKPNELKEGSILLDIGGSGISISAFYNNYLLVNYRTKLGIDHIIKTLANSLNINEKQALEYLYKYGVGNCNDGGAYRILDSNIKENDITSSIEYAINDIIGEVKTTIDDFLNETVNLPIILTGGGSNIYKLDSAISNLLRRTTYSRGYSKVGGRDYSYNGAIGAIIYYLSHK